MYFQTRNLPRGMPPHSISRGPQPGLLSRSVLKDSGQHVFHLIVGISRGCTTVPFHHRVNHTAGDARSVRILPVVKLAGDDPNKKIPKQIDQRDEMLMAIPNDNGLIKEHSELAPNVAGKRDCKRDGGRVRR